MDKLGIKFDSFFCWVENEIVHGLNYRENKAYPNESTWHKAPSVPELLEKMPTGIIVDNDECELTINCHGEYCALFSDDINFSHETNLAEALAQMRIWLHENDYLKGR